MNAEHHIALSEVRVDEETERLVLETLRSGQLAQGPMVQRFELACAEMAGARHAVAVNNGTTALVLALQAAGIGPGDEVITTPFTFAATLNAILHVGATAVFADIGDDMTIDATQIEALVSERTRAIMPVHLFGLPADMDVISKIAESHGLLIVEDAAQAHGALVAGRPVGTYGLATFSFYATKNITTGEGGVVTTDNDDLADRMRLLRNQGMRVRYQYEVPGFNYRMTDVIAAIGMSQFSKRHRNDELRAENATVLSQRLSGIPELVLPPTPVGRSSVWHQYTLRLRGLDRDSFVAALGAAGVGCGVYYPRAAYDYACYRSHAQVRIPEVCVVAERTAQQVVSIPVHQYLGDDDINRIVTAVIAATKSAVRT